MSSFIKQDPYNRQRPPYGEQGGYGEERIYGEPDDYRGPPHWRPPFDDRVRTYTFLLEKANYHRIKGQSRKHLKSYPRFADKI